MAEFFNTGLSQQQFLEEYWQKKPLLIRNAFNYPLIDFTADDLEGLAMEEEVESRFINQPKDNVWTLKQGPFDADFFTNLAEKNWTLLVQDVDKHWPTSQKIFDPLRFIADWRREDLMVSYAVPGGSVGPHLDSYDVFLVQAEGIRHWQISDQIVNAPHWQKHSDLRVLETFESDHQWDLHPGDILYLPPHFAHHGIAKTACLTLSVGFRAPSQMQLLDAVVNTLLDTQAIEQLYSDADLKVSPQSTRIDDAAIARCKALLIQSINAADTELVQALGQLLTETKSNLQTLALAYQAEETDQARLDEAFMQGGKLLRNPYTRFAWFADASQAYCFVDGERYSLPDDSVALLTVLCDAPLIDETHWTQLKTSPDVIALMLALIAEGALYWANQFAD